MHKHAASALGSGSGPPGEKASDSYSRGAESAAAAAAAGVGAALVRSSSCSNGFMDPHTAAHLMALPPLKVWLAMCLGLPHAATVLGNSATPQTLWEAAVAVCCCVSRIEAVWAG